MKLPVVVHVRKQRKGETHVSTREGIAAVEPDDLIMQGVSGEEYPIGRVIFEQTYSLNTTPPTAQRKPLDDWDIDLIRHNIGVDIDSFWVRKFARAIEAAHGIKEKTNAA
jgi:hypothetical protein